MLESNQHKLQSQYSFHDSFIHVSSMYLLHTSNQFNSDEREIKFRKKLAVIRSPSIETSIFQEGICGVNRQP